MRFYTNVTRWGNNLLLREYKDGQRIDRKVKYQPTLYSTVKKPTEYKTLEGEYVTPTKHLSMKDAKEWMSQYQPDMVCMEILCLHILILQTSIQTMWSGI